MEAVRNNNAIDLVFYSLAILLLHCTVRPVTSQRTTILYLYV
jgi:hypothetical protein